MKVVEVTGPSMAPYIRSGDLLLVEEITREPSFGSLVMARNSEGKDIVHRYLSDGRTKGDRVKDFDEVEHIHALVISVFDRYRDRYYPVPSQNYLMGFLSILNQRRFYPVHYLCSGILKVVGTVTRPS